MTTLAAMIHFPPLTAALIAVVCAHGALQAQVLRCEDAKGNVTYTNTGCEHSKAVTQVVAPMSEPERAQQDAQYQQALQRKHAEQLLQTERDAAAQQAQAAQRPSPAPAPAPVIVQIPDRDPSSYVPLYPARPPHMRPPPPPRPQPPQQATNCNVFRCYDGKGNTWARP